MATDNYLSIYDELVDLLVKGADAMELSAFRLSSEKQRQLDGLLEKNREGRLSSSESAELDAFEHFEHLVRLLKARVRRRDIRC
jgi:hypothetical protein